MGIYPRSVCMFLLFWLDWLKGDPGVYQKVQQIMSGLCWDPLDASSLVMCSLMQEVYLPL